MLDRLKLFKLEQDHGPRHDRKNDQNKKNNLGWEGSPKNEPKNAAAKPFFRRFNDTWRLKKGLGVEVKITHPTPSGVTLARRWESAVLQRYHAPLYAVKCMIRWYFLLLVPVTGHDRIGAIPADRRRQERRSR